MLSTCMPADACWPNSTAWAALNASTSGALALPGTPAFANASAMKYPNWQFAEGHKSSPSALPSYALLVRGVADVQAAVRFAAERNVRLAIKSTGHTYTGRSTAAGSLLLYLHEMRDVQQHDAFDDGCGGASGPPAVSVQPGVDFGTLYPAVDKRGLVVVGGGGFTVGSAGGYLAGGGHSPLSRSLGLAADNALSLDVVVANGSLITATACRAADLFWALRGGGGGTFGVVVSATYRLHADPGFVGVKASYPMSSASVTDWLAALMVAQPALPKEWGCYLSCIPGAAAVAKRAKFKLSCLYFGNATDAAAASLAPVKAAFDDHPAGGATWQLTAYDTFWAWKHGDDGGDTTGVASVLTSRILPPPSFAPSAAAALASSFVGAVEQGVNLQIVLLLGGAAGGAHDNAVSKWMRGGLWHVVAASGWLPAEPDALQTRTISKVRAYGDELRRLVPNSGAYLNEDDWLEPGWQDSFFGDNYARLLGVKRSVDPRGVFQCHNCVGSNGTSSATGSASCVHCGTKNLWHGHKRVC